MKGTNKRKNRPDSDESDEGEREQSHTLEVEVSKETQAQAADVSKDGQRRVAIWDRRNSRKISGFVAPMLKNLKGYLAKNPQCNCVIVIIRLQSLNSNVTYR